ncbi:extracellular solute-binding protein [Paenibacillus residui]|uniref:Extracellular solute-binding protein n=1 Tax=Paenibacillus residui TaxID=629724 RepID=A0ABW3D566_9BACL
MNKKSIALPFSVLLSSSLVLSACGGSTSSGGGQPTDKDQAPVELTLNTLSYGTQFPDDNNPVVKEFEKRTNTKLKIDWVPVTTSEDKFKVLYASGNLPDVTFVEDLNDSQIRGLIKQGVFWDLTPYIKDYPNLMNPNLAEMWEIAKIEGKNYSIPRYYPTHGGGVFPMLRKDWLDKLGMEVPETLDEFYEALKAFKEKDPDGNGVDDTIGYSAGLAYMGFIYNVFNDTQGAWKLRDGKLYPIITEDASRDALLWLKKAYEDGLFPPDFAILKFSQINDILHSGKAGGGGYAMNNSLTRTQEIRKIDPEANLIPLAYLKGPEGNEYVPSGAPFYGHFLVPKKVPEEKLKAILGFMDFGYSQEGSDLATYGIPDVHYKMENGQRIPTEQAKKDLVADAMHYFFHPLGDEIVLGDPSTTTPEIFERNVQILEERKKVKVDYPSLGLVSDANTKLMPDIKQKVDDMRTKVVLGQVTIEAYDEFIEKLKQDADLQKIVKEMNEAYQQKLASQ